MANGSTGDADFNVAFSQHGHSEPALIERGQYEIETFLLRFGEDYRELLNYSAIPVVITPELLNYLRVQFTPKLPWLAEVDLLLSELFRPVGYEQYVLQSCVRAVLLEGLDTQIGKVRMEAVAHLLLGYVAQLHHSPYASYLSDRELQRQRLSAMVFINDRKAEVEKELIDEFSQMILAGKERGDLLELVTITEQLSPQLNEYPQLLNHARTLGQILRDRSHDMDRQLAAATKDFQTSYSKSVFLQEFTFDIARIEIEDETIEVPEPENATSKIQLTTFTFVTATTPKDTLPNKLKEIMQRESLRLYEDLSMKGELSMKVSTFGRLEQNKYNPAAKTKTKIVDAINKAITANGKTKIYSLEEIFPAFLTENLQQQQFVEILGDISLEMVYIPQGIFVMGAPESEEGSNSDERPQHIVSIEPFFLGKYPVTQAQYTIIMGENPSEFQSEPDSAERPVENVSWDDVMEFCRRLSQQLGKEYRLPSEAEWEYACRAMTAPPASFQDGEEKLVYSPFHFGETLDAQIANYNATYVYGWGKKGEYREQTTPVGYFKVANAFGLFNMHGNVWEWCADRWNEDYEGAPTDGSAWIEGGEQELHPLRGGSWFNDPVNCRSAVRIHLNADLHDDVIGFRVACFARGLL
jgi:formylglycine-generating enzyme required for sulfatase activity